MVSIAASGLILTAGDFIAVFCILLAAILATFGFLIRRWIGDPAQKTDLTVATNSLRMEMQELKRNMDTRITAIESWSRMHVEVTHRHPTHRLRRWSDPDGTDYRPERGDVDEGVDL